MFWLGIKVIETHLTLIPKPFFISVSSRTAILYFKFDHNRLNKRKNTFDIWLDGMHSFPKVTIMLNKDMHLG